MSMKAARRSLQAFTLALVFAIPVLAMKGVTLVTGSLYSLAVGPLTVTDPFSALQAMLVGRAATVALLISLVIPVGLALALGRVFCGWACPQNALSEFADWLAGRLGVRRVLRQSLSKRPRYLVLFVLLLGAIALGFPVGNLISAPGVISLLPTRYLYEGAVGVELALLGGIVLLEMFVMRRVWCGHVCPVGTCLGLLRTRWTMRVRFEEDDGRRCGRCLACGEACRMGLDPMGGVTEPFCHNCGDCIVACRAAAIGPPPLTFRIGR